MFNLCRALFVMVFLCSSIAQAEDLKANKYRLKNPDTNGNIWVYLPNTPTTESIPVILIAPAGSGLFFGMQLSDGDTPEHIPYVEAGYAVISFDLSGPWPEAGDESSQLSAINQFVESDGGIKDAFEAFVVATREFKQLNKEKVYFAGHSSAATVALMAPQKLPFLKGIIAFAPVLNTEEYLSDIGRQVSTAIPAFKKALMDSSPHKNIAYFDMPIFLFSADDDSHIAGRQKTYQQFVLDLKEQGTPVTYKTVTHGGHYQSMIDEGIPAAIEWLKKQ